MKSPWLRVPASLEDEEQNQMIEQYMTAMFNRPQAAKELAAMVDGETAQDVPPKPAEGMVLRCDDSWERNEDGSLRLVRKNCRWEPL